MTYAIGRPARERTAVTAALALVVSCATLGCADPPTEVKTAVGGSVAGSLIGGMAGGREGAILGSAIGGIAGGAAGAYLRTRSASQKQLAARDPEVAAAQKRAKELDAPQIVILAADVQPAVAFPGGDVELVIVYRVVGTDDGDSFKVEERRILADADGKDLWQASYGARLTGGAYRSTQLFKIPKKAQEGNYLYRAALKAGPTEKGSDPLTLHVAAVAE
jgi:hypothetical protein